MMQQTVTQMKDILSNFETDLNKTLHNNDLSNSTKDHLTESNHISDLNELLPASTSPLKLHSFITANDFHKEMQTKYCSEIKDLNSFCKVSDAILQNKGQNITEIIKSALKDNKDSVFKGFYEELLNNAT
jgi:hypothetical protein